MILSEKLKLPVPGRWHIKGHPSGYLGLIKQWLDHFGLSGEGLIIGEKGAEGEAAKKALEKEYPGVTVNTVDLVDADIIWDITKPRGVFVKIDWIICQATLEHVKDPVMAIKNMAHALRKGGNLFLHTHGPEMKYHRHPVDCYRFYKDALYAFAEHGKLELVDIHWDARHCFAAYEKPINP